MADESQQPEGKTRKRSGWGCTVIGLLVLLAVYFLSLPFAFGLFGTRRVLVESPWTTIYAPVYWLCEHVPFVQVFYQWYFSLFPERWIELEGFI
jgi:hypothetical protein